VQCPIIQVVTVIRILKIDTIYTFAIFASMPATWVAALRRSGGYGAKCLKMDPPLKREYRGNRPDLG